MNLTLKKIVLTWLTMTIFLEDVVESARGGGGSGGGGRRGNGRKGTTYDMRMPVFIKPITQEAGSYYNHKDVSTEQISRLKK